MFKKTIAIDIDEVIRSKWQQFDRFYAQEYGEDGIKMPFDTYDLRNHYDFKDSKQIINIMNDDIPDDISPKEYIVDKDTGEAPVDFMAFRKVEEKSTAEENFNRFMYEDFLIEIFGSAPVLYRGLDLDLKKFVNAFTSGNTENEFIIFSTEKEASISPTLFFLSKIRPTVRRYVFPEIAEDIWKEASVVITTDPKIISTKPNTKHVVVLQRPHNEELTGDVTALNLVDLIDNEEFNKLIKK